MVYKGIKCESRIRKAMNRWKFLGGFYYYQIWENGKLNGLWLRVLKMVPSCYTINAHKYKFATCKFKKKRMEKQIKLILSWILVEVAPGNTSRRLFWELRLGLTGKVPRAFGSEAILFIFHQQTTFPGSIVSVVYFGARIQLELLDIRFSTIAIN